MRVLLIALALSCFGVCASADDSVLVGDPNGCQLKIEYEAREEMLHLKPRRPDGGDCSVAEDWVEQGLDTALAQYGLKSKIDLIFLGRLETYAGMSRQLMAIAAQDNNWNVATGHARTGSDNAAVAAMIAGADTLLRPMNAALERHGYRVIGVSVEKVIVLFVFDGGLPSGGYPTDALVHLRIAKKG